MTNASIDPSDPLLSRNDAAAYLTERGLIIAPQTLARKFHEGTGPLCIRLGSRAMYRRSHLDAYFSGQLSAPRRATSEPRSSEDIINASLSWQT